MLDPLGSDATQLVTEAATYEQQAFVKDRAGDITLAVSLYHQTASRLAMAASQMPVDHADTKAVLNHRLEILRRIDYLQSLFPGQAPQVSIESHIQPVQLSMNSASSSSGSPSSPEKKNKTLATAAAIGGIGGLIMLGPISAVAGAVGLAYASTQKNAVGSTVRVIADSSVSAVSKAGEFDKEHGITSKAKELTVAAYRKSVALDNKYHITDTVKSGVVSAASAVSSVNTKYGITDKAGRALSRSMSAVTDWLSKPATPERGRN